MIRSRPLAPLAVAALVALGGCSAPRGEPADLILRDGRVVTMDAARPEAEAIAVKGDRILAVGTDREIAAHRGRGTRLVDLAGRLAIPGFIEGHGHYMSLGRAKQRLELQHARNWEEILAAVKAAAAEAAPGTWITGRGWHQEKWDRKPQGLVEGVPTHESLDAVSPNHPVLLTHASGHAAIANRLVQATRELIARS